MYDPEYVSSFYDAYGEREWELDFCAQPGVLDGGTHILAIVQRL